MSVARAVIEKPADVRSALSRLRGTADWLDDCAKLGPHIELSRGGLEKIAFVIRQAAEFFGESHYGGDAA